MWTDRTELLIGSAGMQKLQQAKVTIFGLGGVGGYATILLARCGVGNLTIIDFDMVDETNINRQVVANVNTVGQYKTDILEKMIKEVNPSCHVTKYTERVTENNLEKLVDNKCDYILDCIDSVKDKASLCEYVVNGGGKIISAMGAGNRMDTPNFKICDLFKTENDGLAKAMRKSLKGKVKKLCVVCPVTPATKKAEVVGSISYYPCMCACVMVSKVINDLIGEDYGKN